MKLRLSEPKVLIDIARIPGLAGIREKDGKIEIGAGTVHHDVATSALLQRAVPGDRRSRRRDRRSAGAQSRHARRQPGARRSVGRLSAVMLALDAEIHIKGPKGARVGQGAATSFEDLFTVDLAADEIITGVQFAPVKSAAYAKLHQRASHFAIVGVAAALDVKGGVIQSARVGLTGASSHATRLTNVEQALAGQAAVADTIEAAAARPAPGWKTSTPTSTRARVSARDDPGLHRAGRCWRARAIVTAMADLRSALHISTVCLS